jgi:hypothetical protein
MAKIKYNVKGVESKGDKPLPKPGVYRCKVVSCVDATPSGKDRRLEVVYEITHGENKGFKLYDYINLVSEEAAWKLRQFLEACGVVKDGKKEAGSFDPDDLVGTGLSIRTRIQPADDRFSASAKPATLMPLDEDADSEDDEDLEDEDGDGEDADDDEESEDGDEEESDDDDSDEEDEDEDDDSTYSEEELNELDDDDLVDVAWGYTDDDDDEIEGILDDDEKDQYVTVKKVKGKKKTTVDRDALIARILEAQEGDEDEDGDDETVDYSAMDLDELKELAKTRKLSTKGSKKVIIARLEKDDAPF